MTPIRIRELIESGTVFIQTGPFGSQLHAHEYCASGIPVVPTEAIGWRRVEKIELPRVNAATAERLSRHRLLVGDILFARRGAQATGYSALIEKELEGAICGTGAILMRVLNRSFVDPVYLSFALSLPSSVQWLKENAVGAVMPNLNADIIQRLIIPLPSLEKQKAIAHILGALDDKIELNRRTNETLEAMARALFKSWFVDFDPVRAKAAGRKPYGMDEATAGLFPTNLTNQGGKYAPSGWCSEELANVVAYLNRGVSPCYVESGGVPVINQKCIRGQRVDLSRARMHDSSKKSIAGRELQELDILINSTGVGTLGRVGQLVDLDTTVVADSHVTVVRASAQVDPWFLWMSVQGREKDIEELGEGSTGQTELSRARLGAMRFLFPPLPLQQAFSRNCAAPLIKKMASNDRESKQLAALRDTLLPRLLSGELRVPEAERLVGQAV